MSDIIRKFAIIGRKDSSLISDIVICAILALCSSGAYGCLGDAQGLQLSAKFLFRALVLLCYFFLIFRLIRFVLSKSEKGPGAAAGKLNAFLSKNSAPKQLLALSVVMLLCWTPYLILMFPGNISMDCSGQLSQAEAFFQSGNFSDLNNHHPLFDTFLYGLVIMGLFHLTGSFGLGVFVFTLLQAICTAVAFALVVLFLSKRLGRNAGFCLGAAAFFALCPIVPIMVCILCKDTMFSWIYLLFLTSFIGIILSMKSSAPLSRSQILSLTLFGLFACLTKQFGVYIVIPSLVFLTLFGAFSRKSKLLLLIPMTTCILVMWIMLPLGISQLGIQKGGTQEMLSIPFQQSALTYINHKDEIPAEEKEILGRVLVLDTIEEDYWPQNADGVKGFSPRGSKQDYAAYLKVWVSQGLRYPKDWVNGWAKHVSPLFVATPIWTYFNSELTVRDDILPADYWMKDDFNVRGGQFVQDMYVWFRSIPLIDILFLSFPYAIGIPALLFSIAFSCRNKRASLLVAIPVAISIAGYLLSPIVGEHTESSRYLLPFIYSAPLILGYCGYALGEKRTRADD